MKARLKEPHLIVEVAARGHIVVEILKCGFLFMGVLHRFHRTMRFTHRIGEREV